MKGKLLGAAIYPHPPILLPEIGGGEERKAEKTIQGAIQLSRKIAAKRPDTVIVISPHGVAFQDAMNINAEPNLKGSFANFGHGELRFAYQNNLEFVEKLMAQTESAGIPLVAMDEKLAKSYGLNAQLDHGVLVPLYFLEKAYHDFHLVSITYGMLSPDELFSFGKCLKQVVEEMELRAIVLASGDLSHRLTTGGTYAYSKMGKIFDENIVNLVKQADMQGILGFDHSISEPAGECGLRSFQVMAGALEGGNLQSEVFSYEGPFGIGYMNAFIENMEGEDRND